MFDTRYKSPSMRSRAATGSSDASPSNPMEKPAGADGANNPPMEKASGFAAVDVFGDMPPKEGAEYTIRIKAVDPESREAEFEVIDGGEEKPSPAGEEPEVAAAPESPMEES